MRRTVFTSKLLGGAFKDRLLSTLRWFSPVNFYSCFIICFTTSSILIPSLHSTNLSPFQSLEPLFSTGSSGPFVDFTGSAPSATNHHRAVGRFSVRSDDFCKTGR